MRAQAQPSHPLQRERSQVGVPCPLSGGEAYEGTNTIHTRKDVGAGALWASGGAGGWGDVRGQAWWVRGRRSGKRVGKSILVRRQGRKAVGWSRQGRGYGEDKERGPGRPFWEKPAGREKKAAVRPWRGLPLAHSSKVKPSQQI